jgi:glucosamine-phosphate N-acetyltransferase
MIIRKLELNDYNKGFLELLDQLSDTPKISKTEFENHLKNVNSNIFVIEKDNVIVASGSVLIEKKIIHNGGKVGHMEDIVVHKSNRGEKLGQIIVEHLINFAKEKGCYKIIADCKDELLKFYNKTGFEQRGIQIAIYFE